MSEDHPADYIIRTIAGVVGVIAALAGIVSVWTRNTVATDTSDTATPGWLLALAGAVALTAVVALILQARRSIRSARDRAERLEAIQARVRESKDAELKTAVAAYAEDDVARLFHDRSRRLIWGAWLSTGAGIAALLSGGAVAWNLVDDLGENATTSETLARLAISIPAVYIAGVFFKRGAGLQTAGYREQQRGDTIRSIPLIAGRITNEKQRQEFMSKAYLVQLGHSGADGESADGSANPGESLMSQVIGRVG